MKVKCPSEGDSARFIDVYLTVKVPGGCMCQVCNVKDDVEVTSEIKTIQSRRR